MVASLSESVEQEFGYLSSRLFQIFKPASNSMYNLIPFFISLALLNMNVSSLENSVDPDQISDLDLHCFLKTVF